MCSENHRRLLGPLVLLGGDCLGRRRGNCFTNHSLVTEDERQAMGIFSARMRLNGHDHYSIPEEYGGPNGLIGWVHTFYQINGLLPVAESIGKVAGRRKTSARSSLSF